MHAKKPKKKFPSDFPLKFKKINFNFLYSINSKKQQQQQQKKSRNKIKKKLIRLLSFKNFI